MTNDNPYQAPAAVVAETDDERLATRGERFLGALVDTIILVAVMVPLMFVGGYMAAASRGEANIGLVLMWSAVGFVVFVLVQGLPLSQRGQTWGKKVVGTRIVSLDGSQPALGTLLLKRYLPINAANAIPVVGTILGLVNVLLIFRQDRRCGHDLIAGTKVVKA